MKKSEPNDILSPMANDDARPDHVLTRPEVFGLLGAPGAMMVTKAFPSAAGARDLPSCVVRPRQTEGPYFAIIFFRGSGLGYRARGG